MRAVVIVVSFANAVFVVEKRARAKNIYRQTYLRFRVWLLCVMSLWLLCVVYIIYHKNCWSKTQEEWRTFS